MSVYYILLLITVIPAYPLCVAGIAGNLNPDKRKTEIKKALYIIIVFCAFFLVSALRYEIGWDYYNYYRLFDNIKRVSLAESRKVIIEPLFWLLNVVLSKLVTDVSVLHIIYSALILIPAGYAIWKYSKCVWLSSYLFLCLTFYYAGMNYTRQAMAMSVIMLAAGAVRKKQHIKVAIIAIAASMFHFSALVFIPIYIISLIKPNRIFYIVTTATAFVFYIFEKEVFNFLASFLAKYVNERFAGYIDSRFTVGLKWYFVVIPVLILSVLVYCRFANGGKWRGEEPAVDVYVNLAYFSTLIWFFITKCMILERLAYYSHVFLVFSLASAFSSVTDNFAVLGNISKSTRRKIKTAQIQSDGMNYPILACLVLSCFAYHSFGLKDGRKGFHGVVPYETIVAPVEYALKGYDFKNISEAEKQLQKVKNGQDLFLILKNKYTGFIVTSRHSDDYNELSTRNAMAYNGLKKARGLVFTKPYVAVVEKGKVVYEGEQAWSGTIGRHTFRAESTYDKSSVQYDGTEVSLDNPGINVIVLGRNGEKLYSLSVGKMNYQDSVSAKSDDD
jgi:hypothetical protein